MKKLVIIRCYGPKETLGWCLVLDNGIAIEQCKTIELPWVDNQHDISCIPEGVYNVEKTLSNKFGKCFHVLNVPGREAIMIHKGNFATGKQIDTRGCILPGMKFVDLNKDGDTDIAQSTEALSILLNNLPDKFQLVII
jgi:hypothetical protein